MSEVKVASAVMIAFDLLEPVEWNPNQESDATFAALVENIREIGFVEPLLVAKTAAGRYRIISGEHRWKAAEILGLRELPCMVLEDYDEDLQKAQTVKMNALRGHINPFLFTRMFNDLAAKYGSDQVRRMMGLTGDREFKKLYKDVRASLPIEVRKRLDASKREIKDMDDLASAIKHLFATQGAQIDLNFVVFQFSGRRHLLVRADSRMFQNVERIAAECEAQGLDINVRLNRLLERYEPATAGEGDVSDAEANEHPGEGEQAPEGEAAQEPA